MLNGPYAVLGLKIRFATCKDILVVGAHATLLLTLFLRITPGGTWDYIAVPEILCLF